MIDSLDESLANVVIINAFSYLNKRKNLCSNTDIVKVVLGSNYRIVAVKIQKFEATKENIFVILLR